MIVVAPRKLAPLMALALIVAACGSSTPTSSPTLEPGASPTTSAEASPSAAPTPSPENSPTFEPTASPTASPTAEPTASPTATPTATPTAPPAADITRFRREQQGTGPRDTVDCTDPGFGGTIHLVWRISGATGATLSIDGPGLYDSYQGTSGAADVPFACEEAEHRYTLTTTGGIEPQATLTRTFKRGSAQISDFAVIGPNCPDTSSLVPMLVSWEIAYATGVEVWVDDVLYATYSGKQSPSEGSDAGTFDCSKESQTYRLVTTGGFGTPAEETLDGVP
jgi:hypothetical protein